MGIDNIEVMDHLKPRMNKADIVITTCFQNQYEEYQKVNHLIVLTSERNPKEIYKMVSKLKVIDIIDINSNIDYIVARIGKVIHS